MNELLKCPKCGAEFQNSWDDYSDCISKYLWEPTCEHYPKGIQISVG